MKPENLVEGIHLEDYQRPYESKIIDGKSYMFEGGRDFISLDGDWNYAIDQYDTCIRQKWYEELYVDSKGFTLPVDYSFDTWPVMKLPCCWNMEGDLFKLYESTMIFTRKFSYQDVDSLKLRKKKVILRIGAANYICRIFMNGKYVGMHRGGSTPFMVDITEYLKAENRILLQVDATRRGTQVPPENTDWFNYGGVYRSIRLYEMPETCISVFKATLVKDGCYNKIKVEVKLNDKSEGEARFTIPELGIEENIAVYEGIGSRIITFGEASDKVKSDKFTLWSPQNPKLYDVECNFGDDRVSERMGFREISVKERGIYLNGERIFLKGISVHEDDAVHGKALTDEDRRKTIALAKELGCNYMRLAHYPHHENMARIADEEGMLLWEEIPVYWAIRFNNPATYEDARNQLEELIVRDINRASVIIWSVGNENADTDDRLAFMGGLADFAHSIDGERLVSAACLVNGVKNKIEDRLTEKLDIIGVNEYMGWYNPDFSGLAVMLANSNPDKPVIITEFGADALPGLFGEKDEKGTEDCQEEIYRKQTEVLGSIPFIQGMTPWILYDFRCPRRTSSIQQYYNRKGLLDEKKEYRKKAFYVLQGFYEKCGFTLEKDYQTP